MKILIIGGSSIVGFKMLEFLREKKVNVEYTYYSNNINIENGHYLDIRNKDDVLKLKENALLLGSNSVTLIEYDLGDSPNSHLNEIVKNNYDLFINLAIVTGISKTPGTWIGS